MNLPESKTKREANLFLFRQVVVALLVIGVVWYVLTKML
jgi:hypothetical protein